MARTKSLAGGCLCGAVRYRVTGKPANTMICHCETCRRAAGAPVVAWLTFPASRFRITKGKPIGFHSTPPVLRSFCGACGTPLTYVNEKSRKTIDVTTCSLDAPDAFPPTHHSWLSDDVAWVRFGDRLPAFPRFRPKSST